MFPNTDLKYHLNKHVSTYPDLHEPMNTPIKCYLPVIVLMCFLNIAMGQSGALLLSWWVFLLWIYCPVVSGWISSITHGFVD